MRCRCCCRRSLGSIPPWIKASCLDNSFLSGRTHAHAHTHAHTQTQKRPEGSSLFLFACFVQVVGACFVRANFFWHANNSIFKVICGPLPQVATWQIGEKQWNLLSHRGTNTQHKIQLKCVSGVCVACVFVVCVCVFVACVCVCVVCVVCVRRVCCVCVCVCVLCVSGVFVACVLCVCCVYGVWCVYGVCVRYLCLQAGDEELHFSISDPTT